MSIFNMIAKSAAIALTVVSLGSITATAQAQSGKRLVVAMVSTDVDTVEEARPARAPARAMVGLRAKHVAALAAPVAQTEKSDCFWCNRTVYISGVTY